MKVAATTHANTLPTHSSRKLAEIDMDTGRKQTWLAGRSIHCLRSADWAESSGPRRATSERSIHLNAAAVSDEDLEVSASRPVVSWNVAFTTQLPAVSRNVCFVYRSCLTHAARGHYWAESRLAAHTTPPIPRHFSVAWSVVCRLSHSCTLLRPFDGFRCHLAGRLVGSNDTLC